MDINTNSNIASTIANSISKLNINSTANQKRETQVVQQQEFSNFEEVKQDDVSLINSDEIKNKIDVADIQKYANLMGENLTIDDINYGLMYGRSVIADYSA